MAKPPPRLYIDAALTRDTELSLTREHVHYLGTVLRLAKGATVLAFNGQDGEWEGTLGEVSKKSASLHLKDQTRPPLPDTGAGPILFFAPLKRGPTDILVQKATELGVRELRPVLTERTIATRVATDRMAAIAIEAAEQCERLDIPQMRMPQRLFDALDDMAPESVVYADEWGSDATARWGGVEGRAPTIASLAKDWPADRSPPRAIVIGPEGGFSEQERDELRALPHVISVGLGPRILKAETAGIAALALWQSAFGDLR